ncbi:MAG: GAF domain-containing protein [Chloroflexi bacterium]|nr:GAF domain-containing protein [Chloroflexota bacterium]
MLRRGILTRIIVTVIGLLVLLAAALQIAHGVQQQRDLTEAARAQSLAIGTSLSTAGAGDRPDALPDTLAAIVAQNDAVEFIAWVAPDGSVLAHSDPAQAAAAAHPSLLDLPMDATVRRDVPGSGTVYLSALRFPLGAAEATNLVIGIDAAPFDSAIWANITSTAVILLVLSVLAGAGLAIVVWLHLKRPLNVLRVGARTLRSGQLEHRIPPMGSPELRDLAQTMNEMAAALQTSQRDLEARYQAMETQARDRANDMAIAAQIGRTAAGLRDIEVLLRETVEQIRRRFDVIYHAQVFLVDDARHYAVLVESTGEAGRELLARKHRLAVGSDSVIGRVTAGGQTVIASDTLAGTVPWKPNPILPDTRAEMALPLTLEDRVIGALDVQSTQPDVFTDEMVQVFQVVADQIAIAIENARLLEEARQRMREINDLNRQLTQTGWQDVATRRASDAPLGYLYDQMQVVPLDQVGTGRLEENRVQAAIQVRGATIGTLVAAGPGVESLTDEDRALFDAVAERVALAVENARLFQQTQRALAETERLYETARIVSSATDLNAIYGMVAEQLGAAGVADHIQILLSGPDPALMQYLENVYAWSRQQPDTSGAATHERLTVTPLDLSETAVLPVDGPYLYANARRELARSHPLYGHLLRQDAHSALLVPIAAGGQWYGLLLCSSQRPGGYEASFTTFASALADQLAIAIENRRLFEEAQAEARRARALAEAGQLASQIGGDYEAGLRHLFQAVAGPGHYDRWWFGLIAPGGASLECAAASDHALPLTIDIARDHHALAEAARIGEIVLVNDPFDHPAIETHDRALLEQWGKHIVTPVRIGSELAGVLLIGRGLDDANLDERDIQLAATLASQIAVATENRRLFDQAESQRQDLQTILDTMPIGVLVVDHSGVVTLSNEHLQEMLGVGMHPGSRQPAQTYPLVRTGTDDPYPPQDWPLTRVLETGEPVVADDITVLHPGGYQVNLLVNAAPILDENDQVTAAVSAFQNITDLHELEQALQDSLRETTLLYEASSHISRATGLDELIQVMLQQTTALAPARTFIFLDQDFSGSTPEIELAASHPDTALDLDLSPLGDLLSREVMAVQAADAQSDLAACLQALGLAALVSVPLAVRGRPNGWLVLGFAQPRSLTSEERRLITTLADQAAITIENQRLLLRTEKALQVTATLYRANRAIASAQALPEIVQAFVEHAAPATLSHAILYVLAGDPGDPAHALVEIAAAWGADTGDLPGTRYRAPGFALWDALLAPEIVWYDDLAQAAGQDSIARLLHETLGTRAAALIPLAIAGRPLGLVLLGLSQPYAHTDDEASLYRSLADQAAVSLENYRLYHQAERRARQLSTSAEISRAITSILRLDVLFPQVVDLIRDSFGYDHAQIFMISEDGTQAKLAASTGEAGRKLLEIGHSLPVGSQSVIGQVTRTGQPAIVLDTTAPDAVHRPNPHLPNTRSEMALPLVARGQIVGALDVQSNMPGAFSQEDTRALASLAELVATAIDNARLFEDSRQRAEEMGFLFNTTTAAASSPELNEALQQVVEMLRSSLNVASASIYLPDGSDEGMIRGAGAGTTSSETDLSRLTLERGLIGWVARHNEAVLIGDMAEDPRHLPGDDTTRSVIAVPLHTASGLAGVLVVESDELNAFDENDLRLLQTLSGSLAAIIQNSRLLAEVQSANERLLEVDKLKTNFLAAMSHELRTPLNSIIGFSRVILKGIDGPLTEMQEQDLTTIHESGKHLLGLVNDILDQAKIEAGKMELSLGYFKLQDVVRGVMSSAVGLTRDKPIQLYTEIADDLPDAYGDEFRTRQVLLNLVSNASKFTPQGSITVSAFPIQENGQQFIQVSVADTGIGIAAKDMGLLFQAFQQVDNSLTRSAEGTGMGLPLARSFTELQGGRIWVVSEPDVGSTFSITVPVSPSPDEQADGSEPEQYDAPVTVKLEPLSPNQNRIVLVAEETVEMISLYRQYLTRHGYDVLGTTTAAEVEELVAAYEPDVVLLDVNLSNGAGWEILGNLKPANSPLTTPVVVCTLNPEEDRARRLGADAYIPKPYVTEEQLLETLQQLETAARPRILLVDDRPETVRAVYELLAESGSYDVLTVTSGLQALDVLQHKPPIDLVILDLRMPEVDGFALLQALRANTRTANIPVLALTAEDLTAEERAALDVLEVYRKDCLDENSLLDRIGEQLGR